MSISFSVRRHQPKRRLVSEYQHCNFIHLSDIYPEILPFTTMLNVPVDMGKLHCGMQTQQWNNGIVKNATQNRASQRCNNIPLWSLCFFIYF